MKNKNNKYKKMYSKKVFLIDLLISIVASIIAILIKNHSSQFNINTVIFDTNFVMSFDAFCIMYVIIFLSIITKASKIRIYSVNKKDINLLPKEFEFVYQDLISSSIVSVYIAIVTLIDGFIVKLIYMYTNFTSIFLYNAITVLFIWESVSIIRNLWIEKKAIEVLYGKN